jgi:Cft2 family RNA processing exonuclease
MSDRDVVPVPPGLMHTTLTRVRFRPLLGEGVDEPLCGVLEIGGCTLLLDVGCTERFELEALEPLRAIAPRIDAVLLSHPDLAHLGGLPYAYGALGLRCPIYATLPVWRMGQMFLYDAYQARASECGGRVDGFDLDDVDAAFEHVTQLKYSQTIHLKGGRAHGLSLTPLPAGRTLGGALWRVCLESEDVVYAADVCAEQERLFNPSALPTIKRPSALIATAHAFSRDLAPRKQRVAQLIEAVVGALRAGASVLLPVDSGARCLEIAHVLDTHWAGAKLGHYPLAMVGHTALNTLEFAKAHMEWMSDAVIRAFDVSGQPLSFRHVQPCHSLDELAETLAGASAPAVVLVSTEACDMGLSRTLLTEWLAEPERVIVFTSDGPPASAARRVLAAVGAAAAAGAPPPSIRLGRWVERPLVGDRLEAWRARRAAQRLADAERAALELAAAPGADDGGTEGGALVQSAPAAAADGNTSLAAVLALAQSAAVSAHPLMPFSPRFPRSDDWGEVVRRAAARRVARASRGWHRCRCATAMACWSLRATHSAPTRPAPRARAAPSRLPPCRCRPLCPPPPPPNPLHPWQVTEPQWGELARVAAIGARTAADGGLLARAASFGAKGLMGAGTGAGAGGVKRKGAPGAIKAEGDGGDSDDDADADGEAEAASASRRALAAGPSSLLRHRLAGAAGGKVADASEAREAPTAWVEESSEQVPVRCRVAHIDLSGNADARAFRALLAAVAPTSLALVRAQPADKLAARAAAAKAGCRRAYTPASGEWADLSSHVHSFRVRLPDEFLKTLSFAPVGQWHVARVRARLCPPTGAEGELAGGALEGAVASADAELLGADTDVATTEPAEAIAEALPAAGTDATAAAVEPSVPAAGARLPQLRALAPDAEVKGAGGKGAVALFAPLGGAPLERNLSFLTNGELRLSELKVVLVAAGHRAEFDSGVLVVNGCIKLRRGGQGQVSIDGPWSDDYFAVRQLLYAQFVRL